MKPQATTTADFSTGALQMDVPTAAGTVHFDIQSELAWGGTPDSSAVLEAHAGREAWWSAMHADSIAMESHWKETVYEPYMAHLRRYAVYFLLGQRLKREKMTQRDIDDARLRLYTQNANDEQRDKLLQTTFYGYLLEKFDGDGAVKELYNKNPQQYAEEFRYFKYDMFVYQQEPDPVWIETAISWRIEMERSTKLVSAVASAFRDRGYLLRQAAETEKARKGALGLNFSYEELAKKIKPFLNGENGI